MNSFIHTIGSPYHRAVPVGRSNYLVQPKLEINQPGDRYEQEADAMAEKVMRMSSTSSSVKPVTGLIGSSVQRKRSTSEEKKTKFLMRKEVAGNGSLQASNSMVSDLNASKGGGSPLPEGTMNYMENAFSADFSAVRVHTDSRASEMSNGINAKAFTHGNDIYFRSGEFSSVTVEKDKLLAHELTHVVQQSDNMTFGKSLQRDVSDEVEAPDLEAVTDGNVPTINVDPRNNKDFIDQRITAVGVGLSGTDFILFCSGINNPIALPLDYIDFSNMPSMPVDQFIYQDREEALTHVPFGPPAPGAPSQFSYYRATTGGLIIPTRFSAMSSPATMKLIKDALNKLKGLAKEVTDTLIISVLILASGALIKMGIKRLFIKRGAPIPQRLSDQPSAPLPEVTKRPFLSASQIKAMRARGIKVVTFRTPDADVVKNKTIAPQGQTNPNFGNRISLVEGFRGAPYGKYHMTIEMDKVKGLIKHGYSGGEYFTEVEIAAEEGYWTTAEEVAKALE